jgi:hypothetical protein
MSRRKPLAALAALVAALAMAVPATSASAWTKKHPPRSKISIRIRLEPESLPCELLGHHIKVALPSIVSGLLPDVFIGSGCD